MQKEKKVLTFGRFLSENAKKWCAFYFLDASLYVEVPIASLETLGFLVSNGSLSNRGVRTPLEHVVIQQSFRLH